MQKAALKKSGSFSTISNKAKLFYGLSAVKFDGTETDTCT